MAKTLARYGFAWATALRSHWVAGREALAAAVADEPTSQWDRQILDVSTFKAHGTQWAEANTVNLAMLVALDDRGSGSSAGAPASTGSRGLETARNLPRAWLAVLENRIAEARSLAEDAVRSSPEDSEAQAVLRILRSQPTGSGAPSGSR